MFFGMACHYDLPVYREVYRLILKIFEYTKDFPIPLPLIEYLIASTLLMSAIGKDYRSLPAPFFQCGKSHHRSQELLCRHFSG